ncbi:MAG TPA: hypothetical protein VF201_03635 [Nitrolancea sp.]
MSQAEDGIRTDINDVAETLAQLKAAVRRNAGKAEFGNQIGTSTSNGLIQLADLAVISAHLPVSWSTPVVGRAIALSKRATRVLLRWYINPIVDQQNSFNEELVRVIASLEERLHELERELAARGRHE